LSAGNCLLVLSDFSLVYVFSAHRIAALPLDYAVTGTGLGAPASVDAGTTAHPFLSPGLNTPRRKLFFPAIKLSEQSRFIFTYEIKPARWSHAACDSIVSLPLHSDCINNLLKDVIP